MKTGEKHLFLQAGPWVHVPLFIGSAFLCAAISNYFAGPTRQLKWLAASPPSQDSTKSAAPQDPASELLTRFPPLPDRPQSDIDAEAARWLHGHGAIFLDARRTRDFQAGHIPGAQSCSPWEAGLEAKLDGLSAPFEAPIVVYCAGGGCTDSHLLAQKLWGAGFKNIRIHSGGFPEWQARGWPVTQGEQP